MTTDPTIATEEVSEEDSATPASARLAAQFENLSNSTPALFAAFLLIAAVWLGAAWVSVHSRQPQELLNHAGPTHTHVVLSHWLDEGYFHYAGMLNVDPAGVLIYRNSTGVKLVSSFIVQKIYVALSGHYSYRLLVLHNQIVSMILSALAGLLCYRLARRFGIEPVIAFAVGAAVVSVLFTFPESLTIYWAMTGQAYALLFALVYLLLEERSPHTPGLLIAQAAAVFLMTAMEPIYALSFGASLAVAIVLLRRGESFRRFLLVVALPCAAVLALHQVQLKVVAVRFPDAPTTGSSMMFRSGLDGDRTHYGDHLDIALDRAGPRVNWPVNREYLFRWPTVFALGLASILAVLVAFIRGRVPRLALETLVTLTGSWVLYAAVFSQAVKIHPWLYDLLLFAPLAIALFAIAPSLLESLTGRTNAIVLVIVFSAFWYSLFQLRLYALRHPMLPRITATAAAQR